MSNTESSVYVDKRKVTEEGEAKPEVKLSEIKILTASDFADYESPKPIFDRILVKLNPEESDLAFGSSHIFIPDSAKRSSNKGVVVSVADSYIVNGIPQPMNNLVGVGDIVTIGEHNREEIKFDNQIFYLVRIHDVKLITRIIYKLPDPA
jgi:co-chaperonin GroES (HSP10)